MENLDSYLFLLKKLLGGMLMPIPVILLLLCWALLFMLRRKTRWFGVLCMLIATAVLFVASYSPLSVKYIAPLEQQFSSYQAGGTAVDYIAVLGSAYVAAADQPLTSEIRSSGIVRLTEGIRIYRQNPGSKLVFTGYHARQPESYAEKLKQLAIELGVPEQDILAFTGPRDTAEEALLLAQEFGGKQLVLVTSAAHMPRAMELLRQQGMNPIPAPTEHLSKPVQSNWVFPSAENLLHTQLWLHEQLGLLWGRIMDGVAQRSQPAADVSDGKSNEDSIRPDNS